MDQPLLPIDPEEENTATQVYEHDTIIVRPPPVQENAIREQENRGPIGLEVAGRPQRTQPIREMFRPAAWQAFMAVAEEPAILQEALSGKDGPAWKAPWETALESLRKNGTWVIEKAPKNRNIVGCRWLCRRREDGRFKVRLVAKGLSQEPGIDFQETFAPVAKFTTLRVLLALAPENDWELHSMDVKTAFLNGVLEEEIYMESPEGIVEKVQQVQACRLVKAIYGLQQSPRA